MRIQKDNGYIENGVYHLEYGWQGYYYKDMKAFKDKKGVCYIPEFNSFNDKDFEIAKYDLEKHDYYTYDSIMEEVRNYFKSFNVELTDERTEEIALDILDLADWQHLSCLLEECDWDEFHDEWEELSREELLKISLSYSDYVQHFYEEHDSGMIPVSIREYYDNDYQLEGEDE